MLTKQERPGADGFWFGLLVLAVGVAIGLLARPERWFAEAPEGGAVARRAELERFLRPAAGEAPAADNDLATLELTIPEGSARALQEARDRAMARGVIIQEEGDVVPASVRLVEREGGGGEPLAAELRLKGDWLDHVNTDQWSLRIQLDEGRCLGMRTFSIQAPKTRGYLWEWLALTAGRREGLLAPRCTFVNVVINGNPNGVYYLEEHFAKELLESQGRREGPIVLWDESTFWTSLLESHGVGVRSGRIPPPSTSASARSESVAPVRAYGEKRLESIESLRRTLYDALEEMRALRTLSLAKQPLADRIEVLQELSRLRGRTLEDLVDVDRLACAHALMSLLQVRHALAWHNLRFYHNPVLDRLEPILFDNMAHQPSERVPVPFRAAGMVRELLQSRRYYDGVFRYMGELCEPAWLEGLFEEVEPELRRFEAALVAEGSLPPAYRVDAMKQRLRAQQGYLHQILYPADPLNVEAFYEVDGDDALVSGTLEVQAWATTQTPVVVEGFRFANGGFVRALPHVSAGRAGCGATPDEGVTLPYDGSTVTFRFPIDERLANLESAREIKRAIRERTDASAGLDFDVSIVFRPIAAEESREELLRFRRFDPAWAAEAGRPEPPGVEEALERYPFLERSLETGDLRIRAGTWDVAGDLLVPRGQALWIEQGTVLRFEEGAVLLSEAPLRFDGRPDAPIVLEPAEDAASWSGVVVLGAVERSRWRHVVVRSTDAVARSGWVLTGGVTFYRSSVSMADCSFEDSRAEDALNVFGSDLSLERVAFSGCDSDAFDGDFVTGTLTACTFADGRADGADVSGSDVELIDCRFSDLDDKAISVGERSRARVRGGSIERVGLGVVSKDASQVIVERTSIRDAASYALAAYVKKPEFGPGTLAASDVEIGGSGLGDALAQTGCTLEIDGRPVETQELDVDRLYREGVLGR